MAFEYIDAVTGEILGILDKQIKEHYRENYPYKTLKKVKTSTININSSYVDVIMEMYPQVKIIIDRFHLVQLINRSMYKTRVHVTNRLKTSNNEDMKP